MYFENQSVKYSEKNIFLDFSNGDLMNHKSLTDNRFIKINPNDKLLSDQNTFLKQYVELIGIVGVANNSREWWASQLASKNRFTSRLPELLVQYVQCTHVIRKESFDNLLILLKDPLLLNPLRKLSKKSGLRTISLGKYPFPLNTKYSIDIARSINNVKNILMNSIRSGKSIFHQYISLSKKISYVRKNLSPEVIGRLSDDKTYFLIKTFASKHSFDKNGQFVDSFFGILPRYLQGSGKVVTLVHILDNYEEIIDKINTSRDSLIIPYEYFISRWDALVSSLRIILWQFRINITLFQGYDVSKIVKLELERSGISLKQHVYYCCIKNLLKTISVNRCFLTYENVAWENMFILAFRNFSPESRIIGYQHTVVPLAAAGMFTSKSDSGIKPLPDKILTVGEVNRNILLKYGDYPEEMVVASCALRFDYLSGVNIRKRNRTGNILLALEGIHSIYKMVNYVLRELCNKKDFNITIRTHPVLPFERIEKRIDHNIEQIKNVTISKNDLVIDDLHEADIVIYWGTTVALEALSLGIPLIRYRMGNLLSYDPLFECDHLKWECSEDNSLIDTIESIYQLSDEEFSKRAQEAKKYLDRYFHPVTDSNLNKFVCV